VSILDVYSVTLGQVFDWAATLGIDAVIVKGGSNSEAYVYVPESYGDIGLHAPTNPKNNTYYEISHIEFCYDYELTAAKTANAEFTRTYEWDITKDYDGTYNLLAGGSVDHDYLVTVDKTGYTDSDFKVTGTITVTNNTPFDGVAYTVTDKVGTIDAEVTCPQPQELDSGEFAECTYTADLLAKANGTNTATISTTHGFVGGDIATADYVFGDPTTEVYATINVTDTNVVGGLGLASGFAEWKYSKEFKCSTDPDDYTDGFYTYDHINTAEITETGQQDTATVTVNCTLDPLVPTKTAEGSYDRTVTWELEKTVDPASHTGFAGMTAGGSTWTVKATKTEVSDNYKVVGSISVYNPAAIPQTFTVEDYLDDGSEAEVTCPSLTVDPKATVNCTYTADATAKATENTVKVTAPGNSPQFDNATFTYKENLIGSDKGNLIDERFDYDEVISGTTTVTFPESFECSKDPTLYESDGVYSYKVENEATLNGNIGLKDSAEVNVTCYAPVVSKTAAGTYDETHTWKIEKSVDPTSQSGYPGDLLDWLWTVKVSESFVDSNFAIKGMIEVFNPAPMPMDVVLTDVLDDVTPVSIDYCETPAAEFVLIDGKLQVPSKTTAICYYTAKPDDASATLNTATATLNDIAFTGTAKVEFVANVINDTAVVDDDMESDFPLKLTAGKGPWSWTEPGTHTCSSDASDYYSNGQYDETLYNTATVTGSDGQYDEASAETYYLCEAGFVDLLKLTDGLVDPYKNWSFALYLGPDGFGGKQVGETSSTLGDEDGVLEFGNPALSPEKTYTICELGIAAGWSSKWWLMPDTGLLPYNPDEDNVPPEDLGNRCVDFGAGTTIPISVGETIHFKVDNSYPGGDPRTPGYWKNWNRCTGGGQAATADANGGWEEGFWLLEDVLDPDIGGGISWADITIDNCLDAVNILDKRTLEGKKVASDPFHNLATHLLAAQLNFGAGACTTPEVLAKALEAEILLDKVNFNGLTYIKPDKKSSDIALANSLATYLDDYNNGMYCGSLMP
jgi:hypothetical protein